MAAELAAAPDILRTRAPAKINLTLHVRGRRADGYHLLESLVAFAGVGDALQLDPSEPLGLTVSGPFAAGTGGTADNLVLKAVRHLASRLPDLRTGHFHLVKRLPVASGMGGGSSDAAAALRLVARLNALKLDHPVLMEAARATGADVPVCLAARSRIMSGIGDVLGPALRPPSRHAVLVNPGVHVATPDVFRALGLVADEMHMVDHRADDVAMGRNDLEAPAIRVAPVIADVLSALQADPACRIARMSGSGATCFGVYETSFASAAAARAIHQRHPEWWVKATVLR